MTPRVLRAFLACATILAATGSSWADNINAYLTPFAPGVLGTSGTPWLITQGNTSTAQIVQVTAGQFSSPPGPGVGTYVAQTTGGGVIIQDITGLTWKSNTNYTLDFFIGVPTGQAAPPTMTVSLLYSTGSGVAQDGLSTIDGTVNGVAFTDSSVFGLSPAAAGQWKEYFLSLNVPSLVGQDSLNKPVAVLFRADGSSNALVDWYFAGVPGPLAGAGLPGLAFVGAGAFLVWRRRQRTKLLPS